MLRRALDSRPSLCAGYIGIAGVYDIVAHYVMEYSRGLHEVSPMKPACGGPLLSSWPSTPTDCDPRRLFSAAIMNNDNIYDTHRVPLVERGVSSSVTAMQPCDATSPSGIHVYGMIDPVPSSVWTPPFPLSLYRALYFFQSTSSTIIAQRLTVKQAQLLPRVLLIHGDHDETVKFAGALHLASALQRAYNGGHAVANTDELIDRGISTYE